MPNIGRKAAVGLALGAVGIHGFGQGVSSRGLGDDFYDLTLGDPQADQTIFGTNINPINLLFPITKPSLMIAAGGGIGSNSGWGNAPQRALGTGVGAGVGAGLGYGVGRLFRRGGVGGAIAGGIVGATMGFGASSPTGTKLLAARQAGLLNSRMVGDYARGYDYYNNRMPQVDGSTVLGMYNSRFG